VLRENQHTDIGKARADALSRHQSLVGEAGRHADVDERDIGQMAGDRLVQLRRVRAGRRDLDTMVAQQRGDPVSNERRVVRDHHAQCDPAAATPANLVHLHPPRQPREADLAADAEAQLRDT
jgi:hypothetical protein